MANNRMFNKEHWFEQITEETLWHYTSVDVLDKLANPDGCIKATHYESEIDKTELCYGRELWASIINKKGNWQFPKSYSDSEIKALLDPQYGGYDREKMIEESECVKILKENIFLFCMTTLEDNLFHWKHYAEKGISIGFNVAKLKKIITNKIENFKKSELKFNVISLINCDIPYQMHLHYCMYGEKDNENDMNNTIDKMLPYLDDEFDYLRILQQCFIREAAIPFAKREEYSSEKEVRLFYSGPDLLNNACEINEKKMIDLFPSAQLIDTVIISPYGDQDNCFAEVQSIKEKYQCAFSIQHSKIKP